MTITYHERVAHGIFMVEALRDGRPIRHVNGACFITSRHLDKGGDPAKQREYARKDIRALVARELGQ